MEIVEFKDYPNTDTPLNAYNLNRMQNNIKTELTNIEQEGIIVSPTEPTENRRKVWMQKGKNLFNSSFEIAQIHGVTGNNESSTDVITSNGYTEVKSNVQYTISTNKYNGVSRVAFYDKNKSLIQVIYNITTFTTPDNAKYIRFSIWSSTTINQIDSDLKVQVEQGSTATPYEEYIEPKTYILNDNNVYEEFMKKHEEIYSTEEQVIGKWIDGKTLYRKTLIFPNGTNIITQKQYLLQDYGITDVDEIFISHPSFYTDGINRIPFPLNDGNKFELQVNKTILSVAITYEKIAKSYMVVTLEYTKTTD